MNSEIILMNLPISFTIKARGCKDMSFLGVLVLFVLFFRGLPGDANDKEYVCQCRRHKSCRFDPWVGKIPWRRAWQPTPVFLPGESHGQRSLVGYSARVAKNQTWLKWLSTSLFLTLWGNPVIQILPVTDQSSFLWLTFWANVLVSFREKKMFFLIIMTWHFPRNSIMMQTHSPSFLA